MSPLSQLQAQLAEMKRRLAHYTERKNMLQRRLKDITDVDKTLKWEVAVNVSDVNLWIQASGDMLMRAMANPLTDAKVSDLFANAPENGIGTDECLTAADGDIVRERGETEEQIVLAAAAIAQANDDIAGLRAAIVAATAQLQVEEGVVVGSV
ncbi:MAG: hypothetical protein FWC66_03230 [Oscillospiraceae bacterium]|nr:hypothetical protein [Oscillospiraceae bacterium]